MIYRSPFRTWEALATVKMKSAHAGAWLKGGAGQWLPDDPWSVAAHPALPDKVRPQVSAALLLARLDFTVQLENACISRVARDIAGRVLPGQYPEPMVIDALRVQCDEAYHALLALELCAHVEKLAGVGRRRYEHYFLAQVERVQHASPVTDSIRIAFCAAVVAETVITKMLRDDWHDKGLQSDVCTFFRHHCRDEARHSSFFSQALRIVWPQWERCTRSALQPLWRDLITWFVLPDAAVESAVLVAAGVSRSDADRIVDDCRLRAYAASGRRVSIEATLLSLKRAGVSESEPGAPIPHAAPDAQRRSASGALS
jgi:hypothetical protein